jgi:hypothetical protein
MLGCSSSLFRVCGRGALVREQVDEAEDVAGGET